MAPQENEATRNVLKDLLKNTSKDISETSKYKKSKGVNEDRPRQIFANV